METITIKGLADRLSMSTQAVHKKMKKNQLPPQDRGKRWNVRTIELWERAGHTHNHEAWQSKVDFICRISAMLRRLSSPPEHIVYSATYQKLAASGLLVLDNLALPVEERFRVAGLLVTFDWEGGVHEPDDAEKLKMEATIRELLISAGAITEAGPDG